MAKSSAHPSRIQVVEHIQTGIAFVAANAGFAFVPESARRLSPAGVAFRPMTAFNAKYEMVAFWARGTTDPLVLRVLECVALRSPIGNQPWIDGTESRMC
jgi:hypothetical protein